VEDNKGRKAPTDVKEEPCFHNEFSENINISIRYWLLEQMPYNKLYTTIFREGANVPFRETSYLKQDKI
jgi:hypothetical protein